MNENGGVTGTGTAFLVYRDDKRGLFLTCAHNFEGDRERTEIRFSNVEKNYPIEEILYEDAIHDVLLFSVKDVPELQCLELSTEEVKQGDKVAMLGHVSPTLPINNVLKELILVKVPAFFSGIIQ